MSDAGDAGRRTERRVFGRRKGRKLRPRQAALIEQALPRLAVPIPPGGGRLNLQSLFPRPMGAVWLELGFGAGEHLAWQAEHHRDVGLIGCEPFVNGMASLLTRIASAALDNVRVHPDDGRQVIDALPDASVARCFVLFPDPWPKRRHHDRRLIQPSTLDGLARIMTDGAELRLASDHPDMVDWLLLHGRRHPAFDWPANRAADWRSRPDDWPETRYQRKALHGRPVFLTFRRRPRGTG